MPPGDNLLERRDWLKANDDGMRRMVNFEPRGSGLMCSVLLLPPDSPEADFAAIIMEQDEYVPMCGHCIIGAATTVVAEGMVPVTEPVTTVRFDTPAGPVSCDVRVVSGNVGSVSFENVESFLLVERAPIDVDGFGRIEIDVAYGGDLYAFVDGDALGLDLGIHNDGALIDAWLKIRAAVGQQVETIHPDDPSINRCYQVLFTSSGKTVGDYRHTVLVPRHTGPFPVRYGHQCEGGAAVPAWRGRPERAEAVRGTSGNLFRGRGGKQRGAGRHPLYPAAHHGTCLHNGLPSVCAGPVRSAPGGLPCRPRAPRSFPMIVTKPGHTPDSTIVQGMRDAVDRGYYVISQYSDIDD